MYKKSRITSYNDVMIWIDELYDFIMKYEENEN